MEPQATLSCSVSLGAILAWMRLGTGSIWPCVVAHAARNAVINGVFDLATQGPAANFSTGESGFLVMLIPLLVTLAVRRSLFRLNRPRRHGLDSVV